MAYCPKCDMEFVDGITVCSDCGGPLVSSEEEARILKEKEKELEKEKIRRKAKELNIPLEALTQEAADGPQTESQTAPQAAPQAAPAASLRAPSAAYVDKAQQYEDLTSSASAFLLVGIVLLAGAALCLAGIIPLPMTGMSRMIFLGALAAMGLFSLGVWHSSSLSAKKLQPEIETEKKQTADLIQWFTDTYSPDAVDGRIDGAESLSPEELSLKRFQVIQDLLITGQDLPDPSYVDALCEELYGKLYES